MTENLRLRLTAGQALTSANTDLNSRSSWTPTVTTQTTTGTKWGSNGSAGTIGAINDQYAAVEHSYWDNLTLQDGDGVSQPRGSRYNWYTATAMSGTFAMGSSGATNAPDSICPSGWSLPDNSGSKSFYSLIVNTYKLLTTAGGNNSFASTKLIMAPFSYIYSSAYGWSNGIDYQNKDAYIWSSPARDSTTAYALNFYDTGIVYSQWSNNKTAGLSVRCISK